MTILEQIQAAAVGSIAILEDDDNIAFFYRGVNDHGPCWSFEGCDHAIADNALIPAEGETLSIQPPETRAQWIVEAD